MMHVSDDPNEEKLLKCYREGKWKTIIEMLGGDEGHERFYKETYLWVQPTQENFDFIGQQLQAEGVCSVISAGCGTGLLEWLIHKATGLDVVGLEMDRSWWESPYAPPTFLPLQYTEELNEELLCSRNTALLFCYFNNGPAFHDYMASFQGTHVIIIGPAEDSGRHTDPTPFDPQIQEMGWLLHASQEIKQTKDYIVIYKRKTTLKLYSSG